MVMIIVMNGHGMMKKLHDDEIMTRLKGIIGQSFLWGVSRAQLGEDFLFS